MPFPRWLARSNKYAANPLLLRLSHRPPFGAVRHVGRMTGHEYRIPVNPMVSDHGFVVALTYGRDADWVKNVFAAGTAVIEHDGRDHRVINPRVVDRGEVWAAFPAWARAILGLARVREFLRLEVAP